MARQNIFTRAVLAHDALMSEMNISSMSNSRRRRGVLLNTASECLLVLSKYITRSAVSPIIWDSHESSAAVTHTSCIATEDRYNTYRLLNISILSRRVKRMPLNDGLIMWWEALLRIYLLRINICPCDVIWYHEELIYRCACAWSRTRIIFNSAAYFHLYGREEISQAWNRKETGRRLAWPVTQYR